MNALPYNSTHYVLTQGSAPLPMHPDNCTLRPWPDPPEKGALGMALPVRSILPNDAARRTRRALRIKKGRK